MHDVLIEFPPLALAAASLLGFFKALWPYVLIFFGFSAVIFVHELGHFAVAKLCGIRVEKFAIGFFREIAGFTRGETRYSFNILPLGGYVKMLGQEDFEIDKSGEISVRQDPRAFSNKPVGQRMAVISAGVIMNVLFAAVLFAIVFMIGLQGLVTKVGQVVPNGPADKAGIVSGDVIEKINGKQIQEFNDLSMAIMLAKPLEELEFTIDRDGQQKTVSLIPINSEDKGVQQIGIAPAYTRTIVAVGPEFDPTRADSPQFGDEVVSIDGHAVNDENANAMIQMLGINPSAEAQVVVDRPEDPTDEGSPTNRVELTVPCRIAIRPSNPRDPSTVDILGLTPLARVDQVEPGGRAYLAGLKAGDVILRWADAEYPTKDGIAETTRQVCRRSVKGQRALYDVAERDIPVRVLRPAVGEELDLVIRPAIKRTLAQTIGRLFAGRGAGRPEVGATFEIFADNVLRIGKIVPEIQGKPSAAALCGIPPGALITKVDDVEVSRWGELVEQLRRCAGKEAVLSYTLGGKPSQTCRLAVPNSVRTVLGLRAQARILSINGRDRVKLESKYTYRGQEHKIEQNVSVFYPAGTRALLEEFVGQTVEVRYAEHPLAEPQTAEVLVTEDMVDPWLGRVIYMVDLAFAQETKTVRAGNPIEAIRIGAEKTYYFIMQVYVIMQRMIFSRSVGAESISGPVGIVKIGGQMAEAGLPKLLFFLAIISANLAVINFLPLPIVDGGHMVFLTIEKIKGSPVSIKIQMATQVLGLVLIGAAFLYVTLQDLMR